jgi:hypothetical protein
MKIRHPATMLISIQEAEVYFSSIGFELRGGRGTRAPWMLVSPEGWLWEEHGSLAGVWAEWLEHAADVLREETKLTLFMKEFEAGDGELRKVLVDALDHYSNSRDAAILDRMFEQTDAMTPESLPEDWPERLAANKASWIDERPFHCSAFDAIARIDRAALDAWETIDGSCWSKRYR